MGFKKNKYVAVKKVINKEVAKFIYDYFLLKRETVKILFETKKISPFNVMWGIWNDTQVANTYSHYADIAMETLLKNLKPVMEKETGLKLNETYSFARLYKKGDVLERHKDRFSCEVSATMNLGGEPWPIYLEPSGQEGKEGIKIDLGPGDLLIYKGELLEHWREEFKGKDCAQVFLHYNNQFSPGADDNIFDQRPHVGLPSWFKGRKINS